MSFREVEHTADKALEIRADSLEQLFSDAALGMYALMEVETGKSTRVLKLGNQQPDLESLLIWFLAELLALAEMKNLAAVNFDLSIQDGTMTGALQVAEISFLHPVIKAVTFSDLQIEQVDDHFRTVVVFDL